MTDRPDKYLYGLCPEDLAEIRESEQRALDHETLVTALGKLTDKELTRIWRACTVEGIDVVVEASAEAHRRWTEAIPERQRRNAQIEHMVNHRGLDCEDCRDGFRALCELMAS